MSVLHASAVAFEGLGVLLTGPSGAGKSTLALRLIEAGALLVADDGVEVTVESGRLLARCPPAIAGRIEAYGVGIAGIRHRPEAAIARLVELIPPGGAIERLPPARTVVIEGIELPAIRLSAHDPAAVTKLRLWLRGAIMNSP
ncbi:MAG: hypothetical protein FJX46_08555 [Alphaproteobacteria bacterium]|nr:hypothetical protein [Alphaproteobacteria bacterium]